MNKSRLKSVEQTLAFVLGGTINEAAMRTEIKLPLKDSLMRTRMILKIAWDTDSLNNDVR